MPLSVLSQLVGAEHVLTTSETMSGYTQDRTGRHDAAPLAVVRPGSAEQVRQVLAVCNREGVGVVPQGGNTGLVGGTAAGAEQILLNLARLRRHDPVDVEDRRVTVGAGVTLAELQQHVAPSGLRFGVDIGSRDTATLGGMVATNAGGARVLRFGHVRSQLLGVEAAFADGRRLDLLSTPYKDNTGFDLPGLLCGSEGTLGVITAVSVRLQALPAATATALIGVGSVARACALVGDLRRELPGMEAFELMLQDGAALVGELLDVPLPLASAAPAYVLVEATGAAPEEHLLRALSRLGDTIEDAVVAGDATDRRALWRLRDAHPEAVARLGVAHKLDVAVPLRCMPDFVRSVQRELADLGRVVLFGHLGDGSVHVNVVGPAGADSRPTDRVLRLVAEHGGSISAEHGIGRAKRPWLPLVRTTDELCLMRSIKDSLDPRGLMNRGVLV